MVSVVGTEKSIISTSVAVAMYPTPARHPSAAVSGCLGFPRPAHVPPLNVRVKSVT